MTPTLVLVLTYFSLAICAVIGAALLRVPRLLSSITCLFAPDRRGRHRRRGAVAQAEARP